MRVLLLSSDQVFTNKLTKSLKQVGYQTDCGPVYEFKSFWARSTEYDLIIVEYPIIATMIDVCQSIRKSGRTTPIMVVVESLNPNEAVDLFNCGIDDYTSKFTSMGEVMARIQALLRRPREYHAEQIFYEDLVLDCTNYTISRGKHTAYLTKKEFGILEYLIKHRNRVMSRTNLIEHVWDLNGDLFSNSLETHILNLRKKIDLPGKSKLIHTVSGRGYVLTAQHPNGN